MVIKDLIIVHSENVKQFQLFLTISGHGIWILLSGESDGVRRWGIYIHCTGVTITLSTDKIVEILHISSELGAYPALLLVQQDDGTEDLVEQIVPEDKIFDEEACRLMVEDIALPYHGSEAIRQVDYTAFFRMLVLVVTNNIDPRKDKMDFDIDRAIFPISNPSRVPVLNWK